MGKKCNLSKLMAKSWMCQQGEPETQEEFRRNQLPMQCKQVSPFLSGLKLHLHFFTFQIRCNASTTLYTINHHKLIIFVNNDKNKFVNYNQSLITIKVPFSFVNLYISYVLS